MRKYLVIAGIFVVVLVVLDIIASTTNTLRFFKAPENPSNYPTFTSGQRFAISNLIAPKRFDFISYKAENEKAQEEIWMHRLCGLENDTIEIKNGILYVNNTLADNNLPLSHEYYLLPSEFSKLIKLKKYEDDEVQHFGEDSMLTYASDKMIRENSIKARLRILPKDSTDVHIASIFNQPWNIDNFGPIVVPIGKYFVLGDNRTLAYDSRYTGFIDKTKYVGTVLFNK